LTGSNGKNISFNENKNNLKTIVCLQCIGCKQNFGHSFFSKKLFLPNEATCPAMKQNPVVLVCPLDWGLGHAARCVPVIRQLQVRGCRVHVAAGGGGLELLRNEFGATLDYHRFEGAPIRYPARGGMAWKLALQTPRLMASILKEHRQLQRLIRITGASLVISDNRYGLWSARVATVFITHQVFIQAPKGLRWLEPILLALNRFFMNKFDHCWVPDFPGEDNLSGKLSHKKPIPGLQFVGPLTRFSEPARRAGVNPLPADFPERFFLVILSGPEPQRSLLEGILKKLFDAAGPAVVFVRGLVSDPKPLRENNCFMMGHAGTAELAFLIEKASLLVCRPGYSTLMDLSAFGKKALLIPTPGQTEQEYLGQMLMEKGFAHCVAQQDIHLDADLKLAAQMKGIPKLQPGKDLLAGAIDRALPAQ
jgi:hypothetical protein